MSNKVVAGYYRLSVEDKDRKDDSSSIITQREIIEKYINTHKELSTYTFMEFYDDGYSGANMNRPGMKKLLELIRQQEISCIIVKDFSRFSRDYIELGSYLEQILPFLGIRFISIADHYDSIEHRGKAIDLDMGFKGLIADFYSKEMSQKARNAYRQKWKEGKQIIGRPPFGYKVDPRDKYGLVIDSEEAKVVRKIFEMKLEGIGAIESCRRLNEEGTFTPGEFKKLRNGMKKEEILKSKIGWYKCQIQIILTNQCYIGNLEYGKSYASEIKGRRKRRNKDERGMLEKHHEPIISLGDFNKVQSIMIKKGTFQGETISKELRGMLHCEGCGKSLKMRRLRNDASIYCQGKSTSIHKECVQDTVRVSKLKDIVLNSIKEQLKSLADISAAKKEMLDKHEMAVEAKKLELRGYREKENGIIDLQSKSYERYRNKDISKEEFIEQKKGYEKERSMLQEQIEVAKERIQTMDSIEMEQYLEVEEIMRYADMEELNREMVEAFIERVDMAKDRTITIIWKFNMKKTKEKL